MSAWPVTTRTVQDTGKKAKYSYKMTLIDKSIVLSLSYIFCEQAKEEGVWLLTVHSEEDRLSVLWGQQ